MLNTNWGLGLVNKLCGPGPVNTNWGPGLVNTDSRPGLGTREQSKGRVPGNTFTRFL